MVVNVCTPSASTLVALATATQGPKSIICWPSRIVSAVDFLTVICFVELTAVIRWYESVPVVIPVTCI